MGTSVPGPVRLEEIPSVSLQIVSYNKAAISAGMNVSVVENLFGFKEYLTYEWDVFIYIKFQRLDLDQIALIIY